MAATGGRARQVRSVGGDTPPPVSINLDTLEREDEQALPFAPVLGGRQYVFNDIQDVEFGAIISAGQDSLRLLRLIVKAEDQKQFFDAAMKLQSWKVRDMVTAYMAHYGQVSPGEAPGSPA